MRLEDSLIPVNSLVHAQGWLTQADERTWFTHRAPQLPAGAKAGIEVLEGVPAGANGTIVHGELDARWEREGLVVTSWQEKPPKPDPITESVVQLTKQLSAQRRPKERVLNPAAQQAREELIQSLFGEGKVISRTVLTVRPGEKVTVVAAQDRNEVEHLLGSYFESGYLLVVTASWTAEDVSAVSNALAGLPEGLVISVGQGINARGENPVRAQLFVANNEFETIQQQSPPGLLLGDVWFQQ
ncbi:hypothetical protein ACIQTZ_14120 [Paenarthrobacter sp. NPDC090520]|uniref:hypothetical protein n=1 Tax=Paenarthrobacter sp. NPDC090520 TaxID=3364382 RepID=UPI00381631F8